MKINFPKIISSENIPIKMWLEDIEDGAVEQAKHLANLPFAFKHVAIMPDSHQGYGMPIGGVLATKDVVIPNAVGVDIGCGVRALKTSLTEISKDELQNVIESIKRNIPVGFNHRKEVCNPNFLPRPIWDTFPKDMNCISLEEHDNALLSIGTLGGGNHFIEIQKGSDGYVWVMIHSGSRNLGKKVADAYNKIATELNAMWFSSVPRQWELAFLPVDTKECRAYIAEMNYCVEFALLNRKTMMAHVKSALQIYTDAEFKKDLEIDIAHNYANKETHFGKEVWVHRKGATLATKDTVGIIPGSQGSKSYIVKGLGNPLSFMSCSHGAGRKMGRGEAERNLNLEEEIKKLDDQGIIHTVKCKKDLDEATGAYKSIQDVMHNQSDLVEALIELTPLAVIKG